jgi:hypothetical protein
VKRFFRIIYYSGIVALFLLVALVGLTQTKTFRTYLHGRILTLAHEALTGKVVFGTIRGNLLTGAQIDSVAIYMGDQQIFGVRRVEVRYDPFGFLFNRLSFTRIKLVEPSVVLTRSRDGVWNFDRLLRVTPDTVSDPWVYDLRAIEIEYGTITLADSLTPKTVSSPSAVNYSDFRIHALQLAAALRIAQGQYSVDLRRLGFVLERPEFTVLQVSGNFTLSSKEASVTRLQLRTPGSNVRLHARLSNIDVANLDKLEDLGNAPFRFDLDAERIDFYELRQVVSPWIEFLEHDASVRLRANGTFGKLTIDECSVTTSKSALSASGTILNLHKPEDLYLDVSISKAHLDPDDILQRLAGLHLPDLRFLKPFELTAQFEGRPDFFTVRADAEFESGKLTLSGRLNGQQSPLTYEVKAAVQGLNLGSLTGDDALAGVLNLRATLNGSGVTLREATALLRAEIDTSEFMGKQVRPSILVADLANRTLRSRMSIHLQPTRIDASSELRFFNDSTDVLIQGRVNSLDLADLTQKKEHGSDLSFDFKYASNGFSVEQNRTSLDITFLRSTFGNHQFDKGTVSLVADFEDPRHKRFHLSSSAGDVEIRGAFTIPSLLGTVRSGVAVVQQAIRHRIQSLDTLRGFTTRVRSPQVRPFVASLSDEPDPIDTRFSLTIRDFEPIGILAGVGLSGTLHSDGMLSGTLNGLRLTAESSIPWLQYKDESTVVSVSDGVLTHHIDNLTRVQTLDAIRMAFDATFNRVGINDVEFTDVRFSARSDSSDNQFAVSLVLDSLIHLETRGSSVFSKGSYTIRIPTMKVSVQSLTYENADTGIIIVGRDGYRIDQFTLRREVEELQVFGYFDPLGISDLEVRVGNLLLNDLRYFSRVPGSGVQLSEVGGILNGRFLFRGSFDHPNMKVESSVDGLRLRGTVLGSVKAGFSYFEKVLKLNAEVRSRPDENTPNIVINGTLPYDLALKGERNENPGGEMDLTIRSTGLPLELIDPFLDEVTNMTGLVVCDVKIRGTTRDPLYEGFVSIQNAKFLFNPLNLQYMLEGRIVPSGRRVALENVKIRNIESDRSDGLATLTGTFAFEGVSPKEFDLTAKGQLMVMKETARRSDQSLYGNLTVATSSAGVRWYGSPDHSIVTGEVFVRNASLTLPPTRSVFVVPNRTVTITFINDTLTTEVTQASTESLRVSNAPGVRSPKNARSTALNPGNGTPESKSFLEKIDYDLTLETQGITQVRFVFNPLTNEELFADLRGRLAFSKVGNQTRLTGEVEVTDRSYYNFIQKFEAKGKLLFTGDPINPELDVVARYEGVYKPDTTALLRSGQTEIAKEQRVAVILEITGLRSEPKVKIGLEREQDGRLVRVTEGDQESNAISFLISGTFRDELSQQQRNTLLGGNLLMGLTSSVLSGPLSEFLRREFGYIRSVDVLFYGGGFDQTPDIRVTGEVGDAVIRFGGRVFSDRLGPNVNIQLPMSSVLNSDRWRNLVLELERRDELVETFDERRKANSARLVYRIHF